MITVALKLARVSAPGARLVLRAGERAVGKLTPLLEATCLRVLFTQAAGDDTIVVVEKGPLDVARGFERIQSVLAQDRKVATYKFALIRALCEIARTQSAQVVWDAGSVHVPLWNIAVQWLAFYWPILTSDTFIAQKHGETAGGAKPCAERQSVAALADRYGKTGLFDILRQIDETPSRFRDALKEIANAVRAGPVTYVGTAHRVFAYAPAPHRTSDLASSFGWVVVPETVWLDIARFESWIEDALILRWARLAAEMNPAEPLGAGRFLPLLLHQPQAERDTGVACDLLRTLPYPLHCVWTGQPMTSRFEIDHVVPYAVWGNNDLWNLLPALPTVNNAKRDALPTCALLLQRGDAIATYWQQYRVAAPTSFAIQIERALGCDTDQTGWETQAFLGLQTVVERLAATRGLLRWEPH